MQAGKPSGRMSKDEYYLGIAAAVAARSTCLRRKFGAIVVKNDAIVATGYNGPARGVVNCAEVGCLKDEASMPEYKGYEFCTAVHAEENAIINAARHGTSVLGSTLYIFGTYAKTGELTEANPCDRCKRALINAGVAVVVIKLKDGGIRKIDTSEWVYEDSENYRRNMANSRKQ